MRLRDYIKELNDEEAGRYACRCKTTVNYLTTHILYGTKEPSVRLMKALSSESDGVVSMEEVLEHYGLLAVRSVAAG